MPGFLSGLFHKRAPGPDDRTALDAMTRPGVVFAIGGRPKPDTRETSWWGGNFIADPPRAGLLPLLQLRVDETPRPAAELIGAAYLLIWIEADLARRTGPMLGLAVRRLPAPDPATLPPVETACRLDGALACLPLTAGATASILPHDDDAATAVPAAARPRAPEDEQPLTLGGWPGWIGPSKWPGDARFMLEIRSSEKGRLALPDHGSLYLFEDTAGWQVRADGY